MRCTATGGHPDVRCQLDEGHAVPHQCGKPGEGMYSWPVTYRTTPLCAHCGRPKHEHVQVEMDPLGLSSAFVCPTGVWREK